MVGNYLFLVVICVLGQHARSIRFPKQIPMQLRGQRPGGIFHNPVRESDICQFVICPEGARCSVKNAQCTRNACATQQYAVCELLTGDDNVCSLPPERGNCSYSYPSWYFNRETWSCQIFQYSGCGGNGNRFSTETHCRLACNRRQQECTLEPETGRCRAAFRRWYYDAVDGQCRTFTYGGCMGNRNNFRTHDQCSRACSGITIA